MRTLVASLVVFLLCGSPGWAQIGSSAFTGTVTDTSGAIIPDAQVEVIHLETNFRTTGVSNSEGIYRIQSLQPGPYRIQFGASGFRGQVRQRIELRVGEVLAINSQMEVAAVQGAVQVVDTPASPLETETSSTSTVMKGDYLHDLPIFQRFTAYMLNFVPGMSSGGYSYAQSLSGFHLAGQRGTAIGYYEDGVIAQGADNGTAPIRSVQNGVSEVQVISTTPKAEYGHAGGGLMQVVKKAGTNELHGMASLYGRTRTMQHRAFFDQYRSSQAQPGLPNGVANFTMYPEGNLGGPVYIPKIYDGRNRTFFFISSYTFIEKINKQTYSTVPSTDMLAGDFALGGKGNAIYDPATTRQLPNGTWTRDPFPNSKVPQSRFDPVSKNVLALNPWFAPNLPGTLSSDGPVGNFSYYDNNVSLKPDNSIRLDHQFSDHVKLYGSYTFNYNKTIPRSDIVQFQDVWKNTGGTQQEVYSIGNTWIINPSTVNDIRGGFYRSKNEAARPSYLQDYPEQIGLPGVPQDLFPSFNVYNLNVTGPSVTVLETFTFRDDLTHIRGRHSFKAGYEVLRHRLNSYSVGQPSGSYQFTNVTAGLQPNGAPVPGTGNALAGFLLGAVQSATYTQALTSWLPRSTIQSFYFQDDWKALPNLTFNLGIRYSNESPFSTKYGQMSNFDPNGTDDLVPGARGAIVHPTTSLNRRDNNNFQPRVGLAWQVLPKMVFRSGFSLSTLDVRFPTVRGQFEEYSATAVVEPLPGDPHPAFQLSNGPGNIGYKIRPNGTSPFLGTNYSSRNVDWWDGNLRNPYVMNWMAGLQRELSSNYMLEVLYQGSAGVGLIERWEANAIPVDFGAGNPVLRQAALAAPQNYRPFPNFGNISFRSNFGHSTFHSGTVKLEKRYSAGLTFLTFYEFSKSIDSQDNDNDGTGVAPLQNRGLEKARAGYDRNHRNVTTLTYELPMGRGKRFFSSGGLKNLFLGGYQVAWVNSLESGNPLTFTFANSPNNYYPTFAGNRRPDLVGHPQIRDNWRDLGNNRFNQQSTNAVLDIADFAYPAAFTPGNSGRNIVTGLPLVWMQVSAQKNIVVKERWKVQIRWDMNNPLKTNSFNPPTTSVDFKNPNLFGKITSESGLSSYGSSPMMHLSLQVSF